MRHALLRNPVKWLTRTRKRHAAELYDKNAYDTEKLANNPFAAALSDTRLDARGKRFPLGNMVQMVVEKDEGRYLLKPVLKKPELGHNPASYILNRGPYIKLSMGQRASLVPMKQRAAKMIGLIQIPDLPSLVSDLYKINLIPEGSPDIVLVPASEKSPSASWVSLSNNKLHLYTNNVSKRTNFAFTNDTKDTALLLLKLAQFSHVP